MLCLATGERSEPFLPVVFDARGGPLLREAFLATDSQPFLLPRNVGRTAQAWHELAVDTCEAWLACAPGLVEELRDAVVVADDEGLRAARVELRPERVEEPRREAPQRPLPRLLLWQLMGPIMRWVMAPVSEREAPRERGREQLDERDETRGAGEATERSPAPARL